MGLTKSVLWVLASKDRVKKLAALELGIQLLTSESYKVLRTEQLHGVIICWS